MTLRIITLANFLFPTPAADCARAFRVAKDLVKPV
jgi:hypothetical protein